MNDSDKNTTLNRIRIIVEIIAIFFAGGYFLYQLGTGWFNTSMSLDIKTTRVHSYETDAQDIVGVSVTIKNGQGLIRIRKAEIAVKHNGNLQVKQLEGIKRYKHEKDRVLYDEESLDTSYAGLGPEQQMTVATYLLVPSEAVCVIDATVLVKRNLSFFAEARSAAISLPLDKKK